MAIDHKIIRAPESFKGLDKRSSDLARTIEYATDIKNAAFRVSGAINKRKGFQHFDLDTTSNTYCAGMTTFRNVNSTDGSIEEQLVRVLYTADSTNNVMKVQVARPVFLSGVTTSISIGITSAALSTHNIFYSKFLDADTATYKFIIRRVSIATGVEEELLNVDIGSGKELSTESGFYSISSLQTAINGLASYGIDAPYINNGTTSAALLGGLVHPTTARITKFNTEQLSRTIQSLATETWVDVTLGDTANTPNIFELDDVSIHSDNELENVSFAQVNNVLYISSGHNDVLKYDGQVLTRAGLPGLVDNPISGTWAYNTSNINVVNVSSQQATHSGSYNYKVVIQYTDAKGNVITSQPSDPIENTHSSSEHVDISVNAQVFAGLNKTVTKLKLNIYRTKEGQPDTGLYYLVGTIGYNQTFTDLVEDADLVTILPEPIKRHDPPPRGKYLSVFKNCLVVSGQKINVNNLQYSLPNNAATGEIGSEYFPDDDNGVIIQSSFGDKITGIAPLRDLLYVFHKNSIHVISGNINELEVPTTDLITKEGNVGCQSFHSIEELNNSLIFLSQNGFYSINSSNALTEISSLIRPVFLDTELKRKRAISFNWSEKNMLIFIVPKEDTLPGGGTASYFNTLSTSLVLAYDYFKEAWLQWDGLDFTGGIAVSGESVYFSDKGTQNFTSFFLDNGDKYDYRDHDKAISFNYDTNWESLREPTIPKKYLRLKIHSFDTDQKFESESFTLDVAVQKNYLQADLGTINLDFGAQAGGGWGNFGWSTGNWGSVPSDSIKTKLPTGKSKCMKLRFINESILENVLITTYELEIALPYRTEIKE